MTRGAQIQGAGLVVRFEPIKGITPKSALDKRVYLPALLDNLDVVEAALHNEYDTLSAGHFSQPAMGPASARQFRTTSLGTLIMDFDPPWFVVTGQNPGEIRRALGEVLRSRKPVHLLAFFHPHNIANPGFRRDIGGSELDMYCTLRQNTVSLRGQERDTRYLALDVSEWRDPSLERRSSSRTSRKKGEHLPTTKRLDANDTLASLSHEFYGTYKHWRAIRDANGITKRFGQKTALVTLPGRWKPGYKIKIPDVDR